MDIIRQTIRFFGWTALVLGLLTAVLFGMRAVVGLESGMAWALANVWALKRLIGGTVSASKVGFWTCAALWIVKFPVLYGLGAVLLVSSWSSSVGFLVGFSAWFLLLWINALRHVRSSPV